ncbi:MAG: DNA helicase UvrD, partial [Hydrogenophaga sp.]|nr:DNA helicase UvrD [Hydrogenophaga sp.]
VSSVEPHGRGIMPSWRHRIEPLAQALESPLPIPPATESASSLTCTLTELPTCSVPRSPSPEAASAIGDDTAARIGLALHRLLQWVPTPLSGFRWDEQHRLAVAREFELTPAQAQQAQDSALAVIQGQAAWAWEADQLTHWGNEVDLWAEGQLQRLDRLVRRADTGCWWVLDYKSALRPERQAALREQLQRYHRALSLAHPGDPVRLAFINARGELIEIPADN